MNNLLIITQRVDSEDDLLGFFVDWLREFSKKFDEIFVITLAKGHYDLPANVHVYSLGKEKGNSKIVQAFNFYKYLFKLVPKSSGIFAHMSPIFVIASWPIAFIYRKKIILWYLHRSVTLRLKVAGKMCYKIVTAAKESLKLKSSKIVETGHGINIEKFRTDRNWTDSRLKILSVGRISKIKNYETLLEAAKIIKNKGIDFKVQVIGRPIMPPDFQYFESLNLLKEKLNLSDMVQFVGFVPHDKMAEYYKQTDIVVGLTPDGGIDKTILEGMASGCIVLASNNTNRRYLGSYGDELLFDYGNSSDLADKIMVLGQLSSENKKNISDFMVKSVSDNHKLQNLINKLYSLYV